MITLEPPQDPPAGTATERALGVPGGRADERDGGGRRSVGSSGDFVMDADWTGPHPHPTRPVFRPPSGAVDAHCHAFGPGDRFPYAAGRAYTPCDAPKGALAALHATLGFDRRVLVQPSCHGTDNRALLDALADAPERSRGVAAVAPGTGDAELDALHRAGVRGLRFELAGNGARAALEALEALAPGLAARGWAATLDLGTGALAELGPRIRALPCPAVIEHLARPNVTEPVDGPGFSRLTDLMADAGHVWSVLGRPERLSLRGESTGHDDVDPFERRLVERFPERVLWGSGWPHPHVRGDAPDDGPLVDRIPRVARSPKAQRALLVDNPERLYWTDRPDAG